MNINKDKKVESIKVKKNRKISELLSLMENTGNSDIFLFFLTFIDSIEKYQNYSV